MKHPIKRRGLDYVRQAMKKGENVFFEQISEQTFHSKWLSEKYGGVKMASNEQIGGRLPGSGPDILKYLRKNDSKNSAAAIRKSLDIMEKLQSATESPSLMPSIQPLQSILGGDLYGAMKGAGSSAKSQKKTEDKPAAVANLIAAALECAEKKKSEDKQKAANNLDDNEINKIETAYNNNTKYVSGQMPQTFVDCINTLIPIYKATV